MTTAIAAMPAPRVRNPRPAQQVSLYIALGLVGLMALLYQGRFTYGLIIDLGKHSDSIRAPFTMLGYPPAIDSLKPEAGDAGLKKGDVVVTVDGQAITGTNVYTRVVAHRSPGQRMIVVISRGGKVETHRVLTVFDPHQLDDFTGISLALVAGCFMPWFSILLGLYVVSVRPRDPLAWVVLGLLLSFSQLVSGRLTDWGEWIRVPGEIFHAGLFGLWPLCTFLFGLYFPRLPDFFRARPWLQWLVIGPAFLQTGVLTLALVGVSEDLKHFQPLERLTHAFDTPMMLFTVALIVAGFGQLVAKTARERGKDARRRLRILVVGLFVSVLPVLILIVLSIMMHTRFDNLPSWVVITTLAALLLFPFTLAYVIIVGRAMDVRLVVRQGLQYAFAKNGILILRICTFAIFGVTGFFLAQRLNSNIPGLVLLALVLLGLALLVNLSMRRLTKWVDKRFFREAYNAEIVLTELSEQVRGIRESKALIETVCARIAGTLHVSRMAVLLAENGNFHTCYSSGFAEAPKVEFDRNSAVISYIRTARDAPRVYFEDDNSWIYRTPGMDDEQRSGLAALGAELLLPLSTRDSLLGFICAGQKRSEEPYTSSDVRILSSVASQTGLALENAQLTTAIASEMAQRKLMAREVEIAREVQERLFPQIRPIVPGLEYDGMCRTALGVGGDYYDFLSLPDGRFGLAVGDVAGKGIPAALLMASLQASLRGETSRGVDDLAQLMGNLNQRIYETSTTNRYATFFYGQYTPSTRKFEYVNAGHNPPMLLRLQGDEWSVTLLEASGTVVGLMPLSTYEQVAIQLAPGDYLAAFTDGVSEAMNKDEDEWGEERLEETLRACAGSSLPVTETMRRILSAADAFAAGAKQHDDMTLVVMHVL